jgi:hypothetical protein
MSRPQKIHKPLKAPFTAILRAVAAGNTPSARKAAKATALMSAAKKTPPPEKP